MKLNLDKRYLKLCKYIIFTAVVVYLLFALIDSIPYIYDNILDIFSKALDICYPILIGFIIAYLLYAPMTTIEIFLMKRKHFPKKRGLCRAMGLVITYICVLGILIFLIVGIYFMIGGQLSNSSTFSNIVSSVSDYFSENSLSAESIQKLLAKKNIPFGDMISSQLGSIADFLQNIILSLIDGIGSFIFALGSNLFSLVISIILSIYVLFSHEYFSSLWDKFFYVVFRHTKGGHIIRRSLHNINTIFSKYIQGQLIEASIVALLSSIVLLIVGVDYAIVIGIIAGVCNLVPYIGPFVGIVLAGIISLFSGNLFTILGSIIGLFIVQQIDSNILCPKIVGDIVGLHPALIIIAITVGGNMAGLLGMLIAVPVAASIKVILSDWFDYFYKDKYDAFKAETEKIKPNRGEHTPSFGVREPATDKNNKADDSDTSASNS